MASLSDMPNDIIYRISSGLTSKEVAHMSLLSKTYHDVMRRRPILVFDYSKTPNLQDPDMFRMLGRYSREIGSVHSSLVRYNEEDIDLETFIFRADWWRCRNLENVLPEDFNLYNNCIALATQKGVRNFEVSMWEDYVLHVPAVMESPENFSAKYCLLQVDGAVISWPNLKRLCLLHAFLGSEAVFDNIVRGCPLLEELELDFFRYEGEVANLNFRVVNLRNLKKVRAKLGPTQSLEVVGSPNLELLACRFKFSLHFWSDARRYRLDWIRQPGRHSNLTKLSIYNVRIVQGFFQNLAQLFPKLEHLSIKCIYYGKIKISSQTVKVVHLAYIYGLEEAQFDVPKMAVFKFRLKYKNSMPKLSFARTSKRWTSHLRVRCCSYVNTWWFVQLKDMILNAVKQSQTFLSIDFTGRVIFNGLNVVEYSTPFQGIPEIEEFYSNGMYSGTSSPTSFLAVLENIFRICRPKIVLFRNWGAYKYEHPRLLHQYLLPDAGTSDGWTRLTNSPENCVCVWKVTGIKVFGHAKANHFDFYKCEKPGLELKPGASECEAYVVLLKGHEQNGMFISGFELDWRICYLHTSGFQMHSPSSSSSG